MIFKIKISDDQRVYAWSLTGGQKIGKRGDPTDGSLEMAYAGMIGEVVFADMMEIARPRKKAGFDDGVDFVIDGVKIDVKTMARNGPWKSYMVNNLMGSQVNGQRYLNDIYVFASIDKSIGSLEVIGWIRKRDIKRMVRGVSFFPAGTQRKRADGTTFASRGDLYEVRIEALTPFIMPTTFRFDLQGFSAPPLTF